MVDVVAENTRALRLLSRQTQTGVARRMVELGHGTWAHSTVSDVERGERTVTVDELLGLALVFAVNIGTLLDPRGVREDQAGDVDFGAGTVPSEVVGQWVNGRGWFGVEWIEGKPRFPQAVLFEPDSDRLWEAKE